MKKSIIILALLYANAALAQDVIIGKTTADEVEEKAYQEWYSKTYESYQPSENVVDKLKSLFNEKDFRVEVYFGTWCSDSQREVPKLIKLLKHADFDMDKLTLVGVGRDKIVPEKSEEERQQLNITNVPTIIVYQNDKELNRFVEYAQDTVEKDLLKIFSDLPYKHSYQF